MGETFFIIPESPSLKHALLNKGALSEGEKV